MWKCTAGHFHVWVKTADVGQTTCGDQTQTTTLSYSCFYKDVRFTCAIDSSKYNLLLMEDIFPVVCASVLPLLHTQTQTEKHTSIFISNEACIEVDVTAEKKRQEQNNLSAEDGENLGIQRQIQLDGTFNFVQKTSQHLKSPFLTSTTRFLLKADSRW